MIRINRCKTVADAIAVRKSYASIPSDADDIVVDLSPLDKTVPDALLLGVLLNLRTFFPDGAVVRLANCPDYLETMLKVCRRERLFVFSDPLEVVDQVYH